MILKPFSLVGLLMAACFAAPVHAGWQKDEVCQGSCGGGCGPCPDSSGGGTSAAGAAASAAQAQQLQAAGQVGYAIGNYIRESGEAAEREAALERQRQQALRTQQEAADRQLSEQARKHELDRQHLFGDNKNKILQRLGDASGSDADEAAKERWLSQMCQSEATQRRTGLSALKGAPEENWCKLNLIHVRCPTRPLNDVASQYPSMVERYIDWKNKWDKRCGGPSTAPGYRGFDSELRGTERLPPASTRPFTSRPTTMDPKSVPVPAATPSQHQAAPPVLVQVGSERLALKDDDPPAPAQNSVPLTPFEQNKPALKDEPEHVLDSSAASEPITARNSASPLPAWAKPAAPASSGLSTPGTLAPAGATAPHQPSPLPVRPSAKTMASATVANLVQASPKGRSPSAAAAAKVFDCAVKAFLGSSQDASFERDVRSEARRAFAELASSPPLGRTDVQTGYTISRDKQVHSKDGDAQAILEATFQRVDANGEWHIDIQYALSRPGVDSVEGQTIAKIGADGRITAAEAAPQTKVCLGI